MTDSSTLSPTTAATAREQARHPDGRFGEQPHDRATGIDLTAGLYDTDWMSWGDDPTPEALEDAAERLDEAHATTDVADDTAQRLEDERAARAAREEARAARLAALPSLEATRRAEAAYEAEVFTPQVLDRIQKVAQVAQQANRKTGFDAGDLAGATALELLEAINKGRDVVNAKTGTITSAYARTIMHGLAARNFGEMSSRDITGRSVWNARRGDLEKELGRSLTTREEDDLAERVRAEIPSQNRPRPGFHRYAQIESLSAGDDTDGPVHQLEAPGAAAFTDPSTPEEDHLGQVADRIEQALEDGTVNPKHIGQRPWVLLTTMARSREPWRPEIPAPADMSMTRKARRDAAAAIDEAGGPRAAACAYLAGTLPDRQADALFAPFGDIDERGRDAVADFIADEADRHGPDTADLLYSSALTQATYGLAESHQRIASLAR